MSEITIKAATIADAQTIFQMESRCFNVAWSFDSIMTSISDSSYLFYVAYADGVPAGYCSGMTIIDELHIMNICVCPEYRRMGIAKKLLIHMLKTAKLMGISAATLEVRVSNVPAITMYERMGFKTEGIRKKYYPDNNEDAFIMWNYNLEIW